ncbi:MAG: beta-glucosidase family protein [Crocinitomicaceae bacterium]
MSFRILFITTILLSITACKLESNKDPIEQKIDSILKAMSVEEKVGQTCQVTLDVLLQKDTNGQQSVPLAIDESKLKEALETYKVGSVLNVGWCTLSRDEWKTVSDAVHKPFLKGQTKAPIIYGVDAIHGMNYTKKATLFPQEIGLAATWNPELAKEFARITAYETRASGIPWNFSPVLDLGRQPLWSRHFETLGEDPYLASALGASLIRGYQGGDSIDDLHVAACMKHFVGYSGTKSGRDRTPAWIPEKYMRELYIPTFKKAVEEGALTVMINSGVVNGVPGHRNYHLLTEVLKDEWGFKGFAVSDWEDFIMLNTVHRTDSTLAEAYISAFNAGVDMSMVPLSPQYKDYCESMIKAVEDGRITMKRLDDAVRRILRVKFLTGLFDNPKPAIEYDLFNSEEFKRAALNAALESITLLKNDDLLPLDETKKVLVAGPTADNLIYLNGAWTHTWQGADPNFNTVGCKTVRQVFEEKLGNNCLYAQGAELYADNHFEKTRFKDLDDYKKKVKSADVVVLCLGEMPSTEKPGDIHSLNLDDEQLELAKIAYAAGKDVILVLLEGRPRIVREIADGASAIIQGYLPGDYGAEALIKLIYGENNFSGRLPYTYPKHDGAIEFYDHPTSVARDNNGGWNAFDPQWEFGFGLSYTTFEYSDLNLSESDIREGDTLKVSVNIKNIGDTDGMETVQLYLRDEYASSTPAVKVLKRFKKIVLNSGETKSLEFILTKDDLEFYDEKGVELLEPGMFRIIINSLEETFELTN